MKAMLFHGRRLAWLLVAVMSAFAAPGFAVGADRAGIAFGDSRYTGGAQEIPGTVHAAYYDAGGEGVAYHDTDSVNHGSGALNPLDGSYLHAFRAGEGVDISFTKFGNPSVAVDDSPFNRVVPPADQLYVGWTEPGEWFNLTVDVAHDGDYVGDLLYTSQRGGTIAIDVDGAPATGDLTLSVTADTADAVAWRHWHHWDEAKGLIRLRLTAGAHRLTVHVRSGGNMNFATLTFREASVAPDARQAAAAMGMGFNLGQMFDNSQHPPTLAAAKPKIDAYYERGFRVVRIPVTWTEPVGGVVMADPLTGRVDRGSGRLAALKAVVDYALSKPGLYVVLNAHHETDLKDFDRAAVLEALWSDISEIFGDRDHRLLFEILNEPHLSNRDAMPPERLRHMTGLAYRRIRAADARRIVIIGGNQWFAAAEMARTWPDLEAVGGGRDAYVMATFHHYDPWTFSGDNQGDYADAWTAADIARPMQAMADWAGTVGGGMPVFIGEWGVGWKSRYATMNCNNIRQWYAQFPRHAATMAMPTAVWDDGGWFQVYDHATDRFGNDLIDCMDDGCVVAPPERFKPDCQ
ncbi:hypothetical protein ABAC460_22545 [Asticcacaulis sp. AC460]|uniref:cellulase family glycosylhydrolase n=1 Tax=Asticcacaulis sp. AC460 TaxID=1282360 RepID=UPI0003C3CE94|nr:cellulase family glycosylhydrolase [Asticcacaulis sp. AC460]ESQ86709.1 hypothetical protein ABAC460_22545 [Asticcacaulis sp. AC460]